MAGHVIECGPQATGGNYPFLDELGGDRYPGFPIAEVAEDGSTVITKQPGTGGAVTVGTVTAQLLYEIGAPAYANPDVVTRFDTIELSQVGPDRVLVSGVRGEPAPERLKVAINYPGGYRNTMTMVLTGLDIGAKAARAEAMLFDLLGGREQFADVDVTLVGGDTLDRPDNEEATAQLRITVKDPDATKVGRRFSGAVTELALASYAGFFTLTPPSSESAYGVYWPTLVAADAVAQKVVLPDGTTADIDPTAPGGRLGPDRGGRGPAPRRAGPGRRSRSRSGPSAARDRGTRAATPTSGVWTWDDDLYDWLRGTLTRRGPPPPPPRGGRPGRRALRADQPAGPQLRGASGSSAKASPPPPASTPRPRASGSSSARGRWPCPRPSSLGAEPSPPPAADPRGSGR